MNGHEEIKEDDDQDEVDKIQGRFIHLVLEAYCSYGWDDTRPEIPSYCKSGVKQPGYHCFENNCNFKTFTYADNEICYAGEQGEVSSGDAYIDFGGDMESEDYNEEENKELLKIWENICKRKINEAFDEFMELKKL